MPQIRVILPPKSCECCGRTFRQKPTESPSKFRDRRFCCLQHANIVKARKLEARLVSVGRELNSAGITTRRLAKGFGVNHATLWRAISGDTWSWQFDREPA